MEETTEQRLKRFEKAYNILMDYFNYLPDDLKIKALKIKPDIESKTLEAHVYRLRKKISKISNKITIMNLDKKHLILKKLT